MHGRVAKGGAVVIVREARATDEKAVEALVAAAFSGGEAELAIVRAIRALAIAVPGLELVAEEEGVIIGHVLLSAGDVDGRAVPAIAPLSVRPQRQRAGIGCRLITDALALADAQGWSLVALLGHPEYYPRFGFQPGRSLGIVYPPVDSPAFMVRPLKAYSESWHGLFRFGWERMAEG